MIKKHWPNAPEENLTAIEDAIRVAEQAATTIRRTAAARAADAAAAAAD